MASTQNPAREKVSIPVQNEQRSKSGGRQFRTAKRSRNEYEVARTLFSGAEARSNYYMFFKKPEGEDDNFADLNYKKRLDALRAALGHNNFTMKKFSFKNKKQETEYKLSICLDTEEDMEKLLNLKVIASCQVIGEENTTKNCIKGLIIDHENELVGMDKDELYEAITSDGVKEIVRYGSSKVIEISFGGQTKPDRVYFWEKLSFPVEPYIDPPTRCFKCQEYGHMNRTCRKDYACYKCGLVYTEKSQHNPKECEEQVCCVNCKGSHYAGFKKCPVHMLEKKWASICFHHNINRKEAKERYPDGEAPKYSGAVGHGNQERNTQDPVQQPHKVENSQQEIAGLKKQVQSLESMFRTFMTAISKDSVTADNGQTSQAVLLAQLQGEIEQMRAAQEQEKAMFAQEKIKFSKFLADGNEKYKQLEEQYEDTKVENDKLQNQVRDLMKYKVQCNVKENVLVSDTLKTMVSDKLKTNSLSNSQAKSSHSRGGGNAKSGSTNLASPGFVSAGFAGAGSTNPGVSRGGGSALPRGGAVSSLSRGGGGGSGRGKLS